MLARMIAILVTALLMTNAAVAGEVQIPPKTNLELMLETPIDERDAPANPEITFKLVHEIKQAGAVLVPKGAIVTARVTRIQKQASVIRGVKRNYFIVGLTLVNLNAAGTTASVTAGLESVQPTATNDYFVPFSHAPGKYGEFEEYRSYFTIPKPLAGESLLGVVREYLRVPKGVRMVFRTPDAQ